MCLQDVVFATVPPTHAALQVVTKNQARNGCACCEKKWRPLATAQTNAAPTTAISTGASLTPSPQALK